jgi:hypothetical protein
MSYTNSEMIEVRAIRLDHGAISACKLIGQTRSGYFGGKVIAVDLDHKDELDNYQWRQSLCLKPEGSILYCLLPLWEPEGVDYLNHSFVPNARGEQQPYIYADRDIEADQEITADHRTFNLVSQGICCLCPEPLRVI